MWKLLCTRVVLLALVGLLLKAGYDVVTWPATWTTTMTTTTTSPVTTPTARHRERTLVLVKPDGVERGLVGEIVSRFERRGYQLVSMRMFVPPPPPLPQSTPPQRPQPRDSGDAAAGAKSEDHFDDRQHVDQHHHHDHRHRERLERHYAEHRHRPFYHALVDYMASGPVVAMVWQGASVVQAARALIGATRPLDSAVGFPGVWMCVYHVTPLSLSCPCHSLSLFIVVPSLIPPRPSSLQPGTIRGDFCVDAGRNLVHGSDSIPSAEREIRLWFEAGAHDHHQHHSDDPQEQQQRQQQEELMEYRPSALHNHIYES